MNSKINYLKIFLLLVTLHSICVGAGLIFLPSGLFTEFGYNQIGENFFRVQGGIFHFVMAIAYLLSALDPVRNSELIKFSVIAKFTATAFLIIYFSFIDSLAVIILSAVADFLMGLIIYYLALKSEVVFQKK